MKLSFSTFLFLLAGSFLYSQTTLTIEIANIRNPQKGNILIAVFKNKDHFTNDNSFKKIIASKEQFINGILKKSIRLPSGVYGIAILDDEDNDKEMSYNFLGIPKEGYGYSNYFPVGFKKPIFSDIKFSISESINFISIKLRYL
ncbi:MAG: hypothetical protein ACI9TK_000687 [Flavobacteriaceae bacterium]|mgnify:CR=1 FL=1|jgi:uncharacterized protein (DUF2141 family)|tara:strand:- start:307 stop:738 length:432 start_codon:yes stop_codon:yes gene_type:complete